MKEILTAIGSTYAITSKNGCTVTYPNGDPIIEVPAGQQTLFIAQSSSILVSDEEARVTACGGSATLNFTSAAPSILSEGGSTGGLTTNERALLMGAAQRGGDNTFSAANTFTGEVDMSTAQVTPPEGWNVGDLTPEAIQAVAPIAWSAFDKAPTAIGVDAVAIGDSAAASERSVVVGANSSAAQYSTVVGEGAVASGDRSICLGRATIAKKDVGIAIGTFFADTAGAYTCSTQGTGSITIGAGANTLNNGDVESSNAVTIGCKAENKGADSVVIGAQAKGTAVGCVVMGAGATLNAFSTGAVSIGQGASSGGLFAVAVGQGASSLNIASLSIGFNSKALGHSDIAIGNQTVTEGWNVVALGARAKANKRASVAIGADAQVSDLGATVIRSTAEDGTYTQLYFSGANTPLANTYENGEAMMGYVVTDSVGKKLAAGTQKLSALFPNNSTFQPATVDENGEWVMPKVFHPSDLDLPVEEPSEPEEYTPLPVYPIVEPEIEEEI